MRRIHHILLAWSVCVACSDPADRTVDQRSDELNAGPMRIVSLLPAATQLLTALGATDLVVARGAFDDDPRLAHLPVSGTVLQPNVEVLTQLRPSVIVAWDDAGVRTTLAPLRSEQTDVILTDARTVAEFRDLARRLGRLVGRETAADSLINAVDRQLHEVRTAVRDRPKPRVVYLAGARPPVVAGPGTFAHELLETAGAINVFADADAAWPRVALEILVARDPEAIVWPRGGTGEVTLEYLRAAPGWRDLRALATERVLVVDDALFATPGPHLGDAVHQLATWLHGAPGTIPQ